MSASYGSHRARIPVLVLRSGKSPRAKSPKVDISAVHGLWVSIKRELTGPNGSEVFANRLDHAALPPRSLWLGGSDMAPLTAT